MKKITTVFLLLLSVLAFSSCAKKNTLFFLNWGEYIDDTLLEAFEKKYQCEVIMDIGDTNEIFYSNIFTGTTIYDVVCPSDYMVQKMYRNGLLKEMDINKLPNYKEKLESDDLREGIKSIREDMRMINGEVDTKIDNYYVPYLWGTWGICYDDADLNIKKAVTTNENPWACLFDRSAIPANTKVAMYDSNPHAYFATLRYLADSGYKFQTDVPLENITSSELGASDLAKVRETIEKMKFDAWGTDNIKKDIVDTNLDIGLMWTGDFLYFFAVVAGQKAMDAIIDGTIGLEDIPEFMEKICDRNSTGDKIYTKDNKSYQLGFDIIIPDDTIAFCDNLVMPTISDASKEDLAYKFIDFMCSGDVKIDESLEGDDDSEDNHAYPANANAQFVVYDTPYKSIYSELLDLDEQVSAEIEEAKELNDSYELIKNKPNLTDEEKEIVEAYESHPFTNDNLFAYSYDSEDKYDNDTYYEIYNYAIGVAFEKYYIEDAKKGTILGSFERKYLQQVNNTINNARV